MYRLYAQRISGVYDKIRESTELKDIRREIDKLKPKEYYSYMIIKNVGNGDEAFEYEKLYSECKVEYGDVDSKIKVNAVSFRAKEKEITRKMIRDYIDR